MKKIVLDINIKAPYFKIGSIHEQTTYIWFIFRGYGQLADEFAKLIWRKPVKNFVETSG